MHQEQITYKLLSTFYIPLGISASLTSVSHVVINGTLSRGDQAAFFIASYAVAMSVFGIMERPMLVLRQTSSVLGKDQDSFKQLSIFSSYVLTVVLAMSGLIIFTPFGEWLYITFFRATEQMVGAISTAFLVLTVVTILSGFRSLYQGVVINQLETNWVTIGVVARLIVMLSASVLFVKLGFMTSTSGAIIFVIGMFIEAAVTVFKGHQLLRKKMKRSVGDIIRHREIARFYFPLTFYYIFETLLIPIIYILLARTNDIEMSIASFALAFSITNMILGFFMYTHQIVIQFYGKNKQKVMRFVIIMSLVPSLLLALLVYTPIGTLFMQGVMGADESLAVATLAVLKFFIVKTFVFPIVDFFNGFLMLKRQTNKMLFAQIGNILFVVISLVYLVRVQPDLNGVNGSIAASIGQVVSLIIILLIVYLMQRERPLFQLRKRG